MHYSLATLAALAATAAAQSTSDAGCNPNFSGKFLIVPQNVTLTEQGVGKRAAAAAVTVEPSCKRPTITLKNGILTDQSGSQGEIVANNQLQFDPILQPGRKFDSGFCVYGNGSLAVGGSAIFYSCISGGFSNLYNADIGSVCSQVYLNATQCADRGDSGSSSVSSSVSTSETSTPATVPSAPATSAAPPPVTTAASAPAAPPAPYPVGNTTTPAASGSAAGTGSPTTTAGTSSTSPATFQPSSGANAFAVGSQIMAGMAAIGVFAMF